MFVQSCTIWRETMNGRVKVLLVIGAIGWVVWSATHDRHSSSPIGASGATATTSALAEERPWHQTFIGRANAVAYRLNCGPLTADAERLVMTPMEGVTHLSTTLYDEIVRKTREATDESIR